MNQDWISYFMDEARKAAERSRDPKTKCGAVIVGKKKQIISKGFNGYPMGWSDDHMASHKEREKFGAGVIHAEHNALIFADPMRLEGSCIFVTKEPCTRCAAIISQYKAIYGGPVAIYCPPLEKDSEWNADTEYRHNELVKAGITLIRITE